MLFLLLGAAGIFSAIACSSPPKDCGATGVCPPGATCELFNGVGGKSTYTCVQKIARSDVGGVCMGDHQSCLSQFCYVVGGDINRSYCTRTCDDTKRCPDTYTCTRIGTDLKVCLRSQSTTTPTKGCRCGRESAPCRQNGHDDCDLNQGYFCLSTQPNDPKAVCTKRCDPTDKESCAKDAICTATTLGQYFCIPSPYPRGGAGTNCAKGGKAHCQENQFCYSRWPGDPEAFCSLYCNPYRQGECGEGFVCDSPRDSDPYLCIKRGTKKAGEDCSQREFLDCFSGVCAKLNPRDNQETPFCTQSCDPATNDCPAGFRCHLFGHLYRYLCAKAGGGGIGTICNKNGEAECQSKICIQPDPNSINKICSQSCDANTPCPGGYQCDAARSLCLPATGKGKIGDACQAPQDCIFGTCVTNSQNKRFCTQRCSNNEQCPTGYQCRRLEFTQLYCLPEQKGDKELGDACPNGSGDCVSGRCVADPLNNRSFCTQECGGEGEVKCPDPYICTKFSERDSFCTPKDYQIP